MRILDQSDPAQLALAGLIRIDVSWDIEPWFCTVVPCFIRLVFCPFIEIISSSMQCRSYVGTDSVKIVGACYNDVPMFFYSHQLVDRLSSEKKTIVWLSMKTKARASITGWVELVAIAKHRVGGGGHFNRNTELIYGVSQH